MHKKQDIWLMAEEIDITNFIWTFEDRFPVPVIDQWIPAPPELTEAKRATRRHAVATKTNCHVPASVIVQVEVNASTLIQCTKTQVRIDEENKLQALTTREMTENKEEKAVPEAFNVDEWMRMLLINIFCLRSW